MAGRDTITIYRGEAVELDFTMDPVEDITDWGVTFILESGVPAKPATIINGPGGVFLVTLTKLETALRPGSYRYSVWRSVDGGEDRVLAIGKFIILPAVPLNGA